jgi:hypothetical protein
LYHHLIDIIADVLSRKLGVVSLRGKNETRGAVKTVRRIIISVIVAGLGAIVSFFVKVYLEAHYSAPSAPFNPGGAKVARPPPKTPVCVQFNRELRCAE